MQPGGEGNDGDLMQSEAQAREERAQWYAEFDAAGARPLGVHLDHCFAHTYKPVLDDAPIRVFDTMDDYRRWCEENLPEWLGYGRGD